MAAMPRHDPIPPQPAAPRRDPRELERAHRAWIHYKKLMRWMALAAALAVVAALTYLKLSGSPMPIHLVIATVAGVGLSVLLGTALMGLTFLSNAGGHDDAASGRSDRP
jgi:uncharacterized protein (DUF2062 family)